MSGLPSLAAFFAITFAVSWTLFTVGAALGSNGAPLHLLGVIAPSFVALALTARAEGRAGAGALLRRIVYPRAPALLYVFAAGYMLAIKLAAAAAHRLIAGSWPEFGPTPLLVMAAAVLVSTPVQAGEEIGWRGYALPRLAAQMGPGPAGIVLGVIWAGWHLPFFFVPGGDTFGQSFPFYVAQVTALSVAMTWLYWRAGGTLLPVMVMHAAVNNTKDVVPSAVPGAADAFAFSASLVGSITLVLLWICAVCFLVRLRTDARQASSPAADASIAV